MSKTPLGWNPTFPHIPNKMTPGALTACSACPMSSTHPNAGCAAPTGTPTDNEKISLTDIKRWQWGVKRRNLDGEGVPGVLGMEVIGWDMYNARDTVEYVYGSTWDIVSVDELDPTIITLETQDGSDPSEVEWNTYTLPNQDAPWITITGFKSRCAVTPGQSVGQWSGNSVLATKSFPVVIEIVECNRAAKTLTVKMDKSCASGTEKLDTGGADISLTLWQFASPEGWQYVFQPEYFFGKRMTLNLEATDIPTDGVYTLEADAAVMDENGFDSLNPTWTFEGQRTDNNEWETVPESTSRLFVLPDGPSYVAFKTTKPTGAVANLSLATDLTADYSRFRITYYKYTTQADATCKVVGYSRCRYSLPDNGGGVGGYAGEDGIGTAHYCHARLVDDHDLEDNGTFGGDPNTPDGYDETAVHFQYSASGVGNFPAHGRCLQKGMCDHFTSATNYVGRDAPWFYERMGQIIRELVGATNHRVYQPQAAIDEWQIERIQHPSLMQLAGYYRLDTQEGWHPQAKFSGVGTWAYPVTVEDYPSAGEQSLVAQLGAFQNFNTADIETPGDGQFPTVITGFKTRRDPLDQTATIDEQDLEQIGVGVERDTGTLIGYGIANSSMAVTSQDLIFASNIDTTLLDTTQTKTLGSFIRHLDASDAELRLVALRPESRVVQTIGSRTLAIAPVAAGVGRVQLEFENVTHTWGQPKPLFSEDEEFSWLGGGDPVTTPPNPQNEIINYYEPNKSTGSRNRGVVRGDGLQVEIDGVTRTFVVESVSPHGGDEAADWGGGGYTPLDTHSADQVYTTYGKKRDVVVVYDDNGALAGLTGTETVTFVKNAVVMMPNATLEWTEYGSDAWATVEGATHWYGEGLWYIPDSWFSDKPAAICFRAADCRWMDHRGIVPATLYNKLTDMVDGMVWVWGAPSAAGASIEIGKGCEQSWHLNQQPYPDCSISLVSDPVVSYNLSVTSNMIVIYESEPAPEEKIHSADIRFEVQPFGLPFPCGFFPDGTTILQALVEITSSGVTKTVTTCSMSGCNPPDTTVSSLDVVVVGFTSDTEFAAVGTIPSVAPNKRTVVDVTDVVTTMFSHRNTGDYPRGYGLVLAPEGIDVVGTGPEAFLPDEPSWTTVSTGGGVGVCASQGYFNSSVQQTWEWGGLSFGQMAIKVLYPDEDKERTIVIPMWPSMKEVVPAGQKRFDDGTLAPL